jgi:membrane protease YdiL (CAAX protease family)
VTLRGIFRRSDGQYRALWRILAFMVLVVLFDGLLTLLASPFSAGLDVWFEVEDATDIVTLTVSLVIAHWFMLRRVENRPWSYARMDRPAANARLLGVGAALGAVPIALASLALLAAGWMTMQPNTPGSWIAAAGKLTLVLALSAFGEELISRGYIFAAMTDGMGRTATIVVSSVAFGLVHLGNPNVTAQPIIMVCLAGFELALILVATRSLYAATAAHLAWNWVMGVPFHVAISGISVPQPGYKAIETGPDWITGGQWGPEGGALAGIGMLAVMWMMYARLKHTSNVEPQTSNAVS